MIAACLRSWPGDVSRWQAKARRTDGGIACTLGPRSTTPSWAILPDPPSRPKSSGHAAAQERVMTAGFAHRPESTQTPTPQQRNLGQQQSLRFALVHRFTDATRKAPRGSPPLASRPGGMPGPPDWLLRQTMADRPHLCFRVSRRQSRHPRSPTQGQPVCRARQQALSVLPDDIEKRTSATVVTGGSRSSRPLPGGRSGRTCHRFGCRLVDQARLRTPADQAAALRVRQAVPPAGSFPAALACPSPSSSPPPGHHREVRSDRAGTIQARRRGIWRGASLRFNTR